MSLGLEMLECWLEKLIENVGWKVLKCNRYYFNLRKVE